ncbi:hypothetical protein JCM9279_000509 [Rhodotorula babjevae]
MPRPRRSSPAPPPTRTRALVAWLSLAVLVVSLPQPASASASLLAPRAQSPPALPQGVSPAGDYLCRIDADCQPCPPDELDSPVCKLWGNRRPLSCIPRLAAPSSHNLAAAADRPPSSSSSSTSSSSPDSARHPASTPPAPGDDHRAPSRPLSPAEQELRDVIDAGRRQRQRRSAGVVLVAGDSPEWALAARLARRARQAADDDDDEVEVLEGTTRGVQDVVHTWEACPKVLRQEYHDYFEFIMCNVAFAVVGGLLLMYRQRTLALRQFGRLAARIMQTEIS